MKKKYDLMVFIGRFQPLHLGHVKIIERAYELSDNVMIGIGSANQSRSTKNPFTYEERAEMIKSLFPDVITVRLDDYRYDDQKWLTNARKWFESHILALEGMSQTKIDRKRIALIGHEKDGSSFYLKMFPEWKSESVENYKGLNSTEIRNGLFEHGDVMVDHVPEEVKALVEKYKPNLQNVFEDYQMIQKYKESWKAAPYPPTFVTVDAVVVCSGQILLVERAASPGKGLLALPGGFLNQKETLLKGAIRELREETRLKVSEPVLIGSVKSQHTFDAPDRSTRGRTITTAFYIDLGMQSVLPKVKGSDDAAKAFWTPLNQIDPRNMYEDHFDVISYFTNI